MNAFLYPICAAISLLALGLKIITLRTCRSSPTQLALIGNFFFLSVTFVVSTPVVWAAVSEAVGIVNFSGLLTQSSVILSAACQQLVLLHLSHEPSTAWRKSIPRLAGLALILVLMVSLFFQSTSMEEQPNDFALTKAIYYPAYLSVYLIGHAVNQVDVGIMGWRYSKVAPTPWLRRGLRLVAIAMPCALIYTACRAADIVAGALGATGHPWEPLAQLAIAGTVAKTIGWILPDWGRYISRVWEGIDRRAAYLTLTRLHRSLTDQVPTAVLTLDAGTDLRTRLYRTMVEVRDAQWFLRLWIPPEVAAEARRRGEAAGLKGSALAASIEAAQLHAAIQAKMADLPPAKNPSTPRAIEPPDIAEELAFQRQLAKAFRAQKAVDATAVQEHTA
ncbi:MAB_1171c family putative transporter [Streptomyces sp. NPDC014733]|uniref:MAB_1171c family putative transporter n=1 Tax=Streptomyces sp. NPDC014733 TaxID=3364885 RepID=UPI0036F64BE4